MFAAKSLVRYGNVVPADNVCPIFDRQFRHGSIFLEILIQWNQIRNLHPKPSIGDGNDKAKQKKKKINIGKYRHYVEGTFDKDMNEAAIA